MYPDVFSFNDLKNSPKQTCFWEGVRNYQARNLLRDKIKVGDGVLFYHSRIKPLAIVGTATVVRSGYPDFTQFDPKSKYYDPKSPPDNPRWFMVDIRFQSEFNTPLSRDSLKEEPTLSDLMLLQRGSRLSVQPVSPKHWQKILQLGR